MTFFHERMAMADTAGLDFDSNPARAGLRNVAFDELKRSARTGDLGDTHLGHMS